MEQEKVPVTGPSPFVLFYQSLQQASYYTWEYGPFGNPGGAEDRSISYYDKGAVVGLLLDFSIRNATDNARSLDDVLRVLYHKYYRRLQRGFTEAEFQQECERVSEYVYTTKNLDYNRFLGYGGLRFEKPVASKGSVNGRTRYKLVKMEDPSEEQLDIFNSWQGEP
jgi:predicted metalloprotease with PDZ domain